MKILVTGGTGAIAQRLIKYLSFWFKDIYVLSRAFTGDEKWIQTFYEIKHLEDILHSVAPDVVIHLAAQRDEVRNTSSRARLDLSNYIDNVVVSTNLFSACLNCGVTNVVNASSQAVYSGDPVPWWVEGYSEAPVTGYGASKLLVDRSIEYYNSLGMRIKSLRMAGVIFGDLSQDNVQGIFLDKARRGERIEVTADGARQYIYIEDLLRAIYACIERPYLSGVFNIGMFEPVFFTDLASTASLVYGGRSDVDCLLIERAGVRYMDISKATSALHWVPAYNIHEALKEIAENEKV